MQKVCTVDYINEIVKYAPNAFETLLPFAKQLQDFSPVAAMIATQQIHFLVGKLCNIFGDLAMQRDFSTLQFQRDRYKDCSEPGEFMNDQIKSLVPCLNFWLAEHRHKQLLLEIPAIPKVRLWIWSPTSKCEMFLLEPETSNPEQQQLDLTNISKFLSVIGVNFVNNPKRS